MGHDNSIDYSWGRYGDTDEFRLTQGSTSLRRADDRAAAAGGGLAPEKTVIVAGHGAGAVSQAALDYDPDAKTVLQTEQLGTAHAVGCARDALDGFKGDAVVLYGDTPFISVKTLESMEAARASHDIVVLGFEAADPGRYGRLITDGNALTRIVEFKDSTDEERAVTLCNSGVIMARR